ncbi:MAG: hypothetical protein H0V66_00770 [Bdellovibrionales bacterium]|nr:hypothetical protein [Bdellovibrionales bacterium]
MKIMIILTILFSMSSFAQDKKGVRYEYKKFEKFDFDEIGVEGEAGAPGDISVSPRLRNEFKNKLPERSNFNKEMKKAIDGVR